MNALRAQAVAARSYGLSQNRYSYAKTCDTSSCQVYGGCRHASVADLGRVRRASSTRSPTRRSPRPRARSACRNGAIVSTEFSASNGPRTAGGAFPPVDDPWDDVPGNPNHVWTRIIDADAVAVDVRARPAPTGSARCTTPSSTFDGIWANKVVRGSTHAGDGVGLPQRLRAAVARASSSSRSSAACPTARPFSFIGDSVGESVAGERRRGVPDPARRRVRLDDVRHARGAPHAGRQRRTASAAPPPCRSAPTWSWSSSATTTTSGAMAGRIDAVMADAARPRRSAASRGSTCRERRGRVRRHQRRHRRRRQPMERACSCSTGSRPATTWRPTAGSPTTCISRPRDGPSSRCSCATR